ncbi:MAG TPA: HEAT repeat domain-containing protein [Longimicrobium sp.]|nr:HEAT repeat domain-containing protein [Longimicrobium sp.]
MSEMALRAAAWLLTYALHSTILLGTAALLARRVRGEAWRETLWKAALVGGLVTATVQTQSGYESPLGTWRLGGTLDLAVQVADDAQPASPAPSTALPRPVEAAPPAAASGSVGSIASPASSKAASASTPVTAPESAVTPSVSTASFSIRLLVELAVAAWAMVALLLIARIAWRQGRLRRMLRGRDTVADDALLAMLAGLRRNAGLWRPVRLTACEATPTPLALGGGEVCVPPRFLVDLDPEQQRSALAHELAHLARRDPAWHFAVAVIEAVFFFQPLNRLARLRLRESAEFLCDEWAARHTGSPLGLARCLAEVASWVAPGRPSIPAGTMAMAEGGSPLVQRVQRLTAWRGGSHPGNGTMRVAGGALLVLAVAFAAPAVASSGERRQEEEPVQPNQAVEEDVGGATDAQEQIIRHPDPSRPLARRWEWAVAEVARRGLDGAWVAYSVPTLLRPGHTWVTDSDNFGIGELGRAAVNQVVGAAEEDMVMIFRVAPDGVVERVAGRSAAGFELGRTPVLWLGRAETAQSFAQLRRLADGLRNPSLRESLVEAIGIHRGDAMVPYLAAVLGRDGSNGVRREAAQALGRHPGDEALAALVTAVERDGSDDVRREAVEAIGAMRHPRSAAVLQEIAAAAPDAGTRRDAAEALGGGGTESFEALRRIALAGSDPYMAREAVEAMGRYSADQAVPALLQIVWGGGNPIAARQAAESLAALPAPWTVEALDSIARTHPDRAVAAQAVESLGRYRGVISEGYLTVIARTHHDRRVREEALDQLARFRQPRDNIDPDPDPDPGF